MIGLIVLVRSLMISISPLIADVNECEDNEDGERDWKNEEETRGYDLSQ